MKKCVARAATRIARFFGSWRFLKIVAWTITLIVLFYAEEDWRGARAWAATKAKWEARGESLDYAKFIPPPVPDAENLAAIPLFKMEPVVKGDPDREPVTLLQSMRIGIFGNDSSQTGDWMVGRLPDMEKLRVAIATDYAAAFRGVAPPKDTLAQFDALYPFLADLRNAAATRPLCRFDDDYSIYPPMGRPLGFLTDQIKLSRILTIQAVLALDHHQSDLALEDIKINYILRSGAKCDPSLIGALVASGMNAVNGLAIYDGLALHAWNDAQLAEIDHTLEPVNFLADYQFAMRSEAAESMVNSDYIKKAPRSEVYGYLNGGLAKPPPLWDRVPFLWPGGWWDQNKCQTADLIFNFLPCVDPQTQRVFSAQVNEFGNQFERLAQRTNADLPWNFLFSQVISFVPTQPSKFAQAQVWIDETRIACALERYRLAHNAYPAALDALASEYIDAVPHDIMNGQPYHYRLRPDGTFLLYSVGWNQTDDGGKVDYALSDSRYKSLRPGRKEGDWVWPTPREPGTP
jgi:hypothetical protein